MAPSRKRKIEQLEEALKATRHQLAREQLRTFEAAKQSRRTEFWHAPLTGANSDLRPVWARLISRHRDLVDNNPWADRAIRAFQNNFIGDGVMGTPVKSSKRYQQSYLEWSESTDCDFHGKLNFYGLQSLACRTERVSGTCLVRRVIDEDLARRGVVPLRLMLLEPDWLDVGKDKVDADGNVEFGKQYDRRGRLMGYWMLPDHPGDIGWRASGRDSVFVPASEVLDVFELRRPGQRLGVPCGSSVMLPMRDMEDINQAQILKTKLAACYTAFVSDLSDRPPEFEDAQLPLTDTLEPGVVEYLPPGRDIRFASPPSSGDFVDDMKYHLRRVASGYGLPYETLTGDYSEVNFSSGRMGWIEFHRQVASYRWNVMVPQLLDPVAAWYRESASLIGLRGTKEMSWTFPRRELLDPTKDTKALVESVTAGLLSLSEVQRSLGYIPEEVMAEIAADQKAAKAAGITLGVYETKAANNQPQEQQIEPEQN